MLPPLLKVTVVVNNFIDLVGCELESPSDREDTTELVIPRVMLESCMAPEALSNLMSPAKQSRVPLPVQLAVSTFILSARSRPHSFGSTCSVHDANSAQLATHRRARAKSLT